MRALLVLALVAPAAVVPRMAHAGADEATPSGAALHALPAGVTGGGFFATRPTRLVDTRPAPDRVGAFARLTGQASIDVQITGVAAVPGEAIAAVLNVTAVNPAAAGYLTLHPTGGTRPLVSNVNFVTGQTVPNLVQVKLGTGGKVTIFNGSANAADVIVDVTGYYAPGGASFISVLPARFTDRTMIGGQPFTEVLTPPAYKGRVFRAVAHNVTIDAPSDDGWLRAFPANDSSPGSSNLNFVRGQTVANAVIVGTAPFSLDGQAGRGVTFLLRNGVATARLIVDDMGYFIDPDGTDTGKFVPVEPCRAIDTRPLPLRRGPVTGPLTAGTAAVMPLAGVCGLPAAANIDSVVVNVTAVNPTGTAFLRTWATGEPEPAVSTLNVRPGQVVANHAIVYAGTAGSISAVVSAGMCDLIVDIFGYYST